MPRIHDRYLEEPPEHPDDCGCRECTVPDEDSDGYRAGDIDPTEPVPPDDIVAAGPEAVAGWCRERAEVAARRKFAIAGPCIWSTAPTTPTPPEGRLPWQQEENQN